MRPAAKDPGEELPQAIEELAVTTRAAMLDAVRCPATRLIAGSYAAPGGGVCPLLAAHRRGGRAHDGSTQESSFAAVWDRFTGAKTGQPRPISADERRKLEGMLVASLAREERRLEAARRRERRDREAGSAVARVRAGHGAKLEALLSSRSEGHRAQELARRAGWAWLGVYRRYDEYRSAVAHALNAEPSRPAQESGEPVERSELELVA